MKKIIILFVLVLLSCKTEPNSEIIFSIKGMTCQEGCANTIQAKLNKTSGISNAKVDFNSESANISYDSTKIKPQEMITIIQKIGNYKAIQK